MLGYSVYRISFMRCFVLSILLCAASSLAQADCLPPACTEFPADSGALNVRDFGAKGDGVTDDTAAINAALAASGEDMGPTFWQDRLVYLPNGTYRITAPLAKHYKNGDFGSGSQLIGQSRTGTVLKLDDHAPGYDDAAAPKAVIFTTASLLGNTDPRNGGRDYRTKGEGNDAFMNFIENLTVDVGTGNPGAVGIDYLANNLGAVRRVTVKAGEGSGATGIAMTRKWPGPAMISQVEVQGFEVGIDTSNTEYSMTLEHVTLTGQRNIGLRNAHNALAIHDLHISGAALGIANETPDGQIVLVNAQLERPAPATGEAIRNRGSMNLRGVSAQGFATLLGAAPVELDGVYDKNQRVSPSRQSWSLPIEDAPKVDSAPVSAWVSVARFGAASDPKVDSTAAIRRAFASGASTIYFPHGTYFISENIEVPTKVRRIVGMTSTLHAFDPRKPGFQREKGMLIARNDHAPLSIERLAFDNSWLGDQVAVEAAGSQPIILRDLVSAGTVMLKRNADAGKAFLEDTCCGTLDVKGKAPVWARQFNTEGGYTRILNHGAPLWMLGVKTEGVNVVAENQAGARTEILGGLLYPLAAMKHPDMPAFRNVDSKIYVACVEEAFDDKKVYNVHLESKRGGKVMQIRAETLPLRTHSRILPGLLGE